MLPNWVNKVQNVEECDARGDARRSKADNKKIFVIINKNKITNDPRAEAK